MCFGPRPQPSGWTSWPRFGPEDHRQAFIAFVAGLLSDFDRYLARDQEVDLLRDGVSYRLMGLWLADVS